MTIPLCNDIRFSAFHHPVPVEDNDDRPVCALAPSTDINDNQISVRDLAIVKVFRLVPYPQLSLLVLTEPDVLHTFPALVAIAIYITDELGCSASLLELVNLVFSEHPRS